MILFSSSSCTFERFLVSKIIVNMLHCLIVLQVQYEFSSNDLVWLQALDTFSTAIVSPIYYAGFTSFTILASAIMFKVSLCTNAHAEREGGGRQRVMSTSNCFCTFSEGLFWSECKQHCFGALWVCYCVIWYLCIT
jgi:hypothetical protein